MPTWSRALSPINIKQQSPNRTKDPVRQNSAHARSKSRDSHWIRAVSGLTIFWVLAIKTPKELKRGTRKTRLNATSAEKAHTSLLRLAEASVKRKAVFLWKRTQIMGSTGVS